MDENHILRIQLKFGCKTNIINGLKIKDLKLRMTIKKEKKNIGKERLGEKDDDDL